MSATHKCVHCDCEYDRDALAAEVAPTTGKVPNTIVFCLIPANPRLEALNMQADACSAACVAGAIRPIADAWEQAIQTGQVALVKKASS
jgi:hypothetical protein